tara:strand:- start:752 stop:1252 length:501 start_codon:yes stop_codon:yes gene_type:complete
MRVGLYPGTFDPITLGHIDIIKRAANLVDVLVVGVANNNQKQPMFSIDERLDLINFEIKKINNLFDVKVKTQSFDKLLVNFAADLKASVIFRGLRAVSDFEYEFQMVCMNRTLRDDIEIVFLMAGTEYQAISSKLVKEIAILNGNVNKFLTSNVNLAMLKKLKKGS